MQMKVQPQTKPYKKQAITIDKDIVISPGTTQTVLANLPKHNEWEVIGAVTPREDYSENSEILVTHSLFACNRRTSDN